MTNGPEITGVTAELEVNIFEKLTPLFTSSVTFTKGVLSSVTSIFKSLNGLNYAVPADKIIIDKALASIYKLIVDDVQNSTAINNFWEGFSIGVNP